MASRSDEDALLTELTQALKDVGLEALLIGNAAAALLGAPVTTRDVDFYIRDTSANHRKLMQLAVRLGGLAITQPGEPLSRMVRLVGWPVEIGFTFSLSSGARFESVRARAVDVPVGGAVVRVASLADIIAAKRAANRPKDQAVLPVLEETMRVAEAMSAVTTKAAASRQRRHRPKRGR